MKQNPEKGFLPPGPFLLALINRSLSCLMGVKPDVCFPLCSDFKAFQVIPSFSALFLHTLYLEHPFRFTWKPVKHSG